MTTSTPAMVTHVPPRTAFPEWTLAWANIFIDQHGGLHISRYTHGATFDETYTTVFGHPPGSEISMWQLEHVGSVAVDPNDDDVSGEDADNPGWQNNRYAADVLGWIRIKLHGFSPATPNSEATSVPKRAEIDIQFNSDVAGLKAMDATIALLRTYRKLERSGEVAIAVGIAGEGDEAVDVTMSVAKSLEEMAEWRDLVKERIEEQAAAAASSRKP